MPILIDRRSFLKGTASAIGLACAPRFLAADAPVRVALFSDTHIAANPSDQFRGFFPHQNLKKVVAQTAASKFDLLVVNGDLARLEGRPEDYSAFTALMDPLAEQMPMVVTLGNHDDRKNARSALVKLMGEVESVQQKLVTTIDAGPFRFVLLDSLMVTNISAGQLGRLQREWLAQYLSASAAKPLIVFVHHNPDPDSDSALVDADRLLAILRPQKSVKALIFGHTHVYSHEMQAGLQLVNLPAIGYNFADGNPVGWVEASLAPDAAELKLHAIAGETKDDGKLTSLKWR